MNIEIKKVVHTGKFEFKTKKVLSYINIRELVLEAIKTINSSDVEKNYLDSGYVRIDNFQKFEFSYGNNDYLINITNENRKVKGREKTYDIEVHIKSKKQVEKKTEFFKQEFF